MTTSAIDWTPDPLLRAEMDADRAMTRMVRDELGGWMLTVRRFGMRPLYAPGATAQGAADVPIAGMGRRRMIVSNRNGRRVLLRGRGSPRSNFPAQKPVLMVTLP